ncbi:MAG: hypothetical protein US96_C0016G0013 [Candidatus Woesebacteria bacterium GW2011_GWB1_38_5b]|uniref:Uncharacterized protein n=1 Tax=Candidatus Woesebacteria bacterium GW2011_GWB1_38_5b TaxID=1618569 RepID=A0A0G0MNC7_9BACT|nr:MAG: hypothetical protein US96_C0016G0013 [Candidatus Woesebacteria bacterium GW2011_GWB1_38_5b]KKQ76869.1 MAG: hypothetical protein UT00_C0029G0007 [Parcubacteria group bacterium GW2011_GWA1_38_7]
MKDQYMLPPENNIIIPRSGKSFSKSKALLGLIIIFNIGFIGFNLSLDPKPSSAPVVAEVNQTQTQVQVLGESFQILPTPPPYERGIIMVNFYENVTYGKAKEFMNKMGLSIEGRNDFWKSQGITPYPAMQLTAGNLFRVSVPIGTEEQHITVLEKSDLVRLVTYNFVAEAN